MEPNLEKVVSDLPDGSAARINGRALISLADSLTVTTEKFSELRGIVPQEFLKEIKSLGNSAPESEHQRLLKMARDIILLTKKSMQWMNREYPALPPDSVETTLDLITRPGSQVVVLRGGVPGARRDDKESTILGYGIVIDGTENFPDTNNIPDVLLKGQTRCLRVIRLFVTETAREQLPAGEAFSKIIDGIKDIAAGCRTIGMVLTDIVPLGWSPDSNLRKGIWLEAKTALEKRGFEDTGQVITESIDASNHPKVAIGFRWYVWPPMTDAGQSAYQRQRDRVDQLNTRQHERLAGIFPAIPSEGLVAFSGNANDAFKVAYQSPGVLVFGSIYRSGFPVDDRAGKRPNLIARYRDIDPILLRAGSADAVVMNGILPDEAKNVPTDEARKNVNAFIQRQVRQIKVGGSLIIRDTIGFDSPKTVLAVLDDSTDTDSRLKSTVSFFDEFRGSPKELHITGAEWQSIVEVENPRVLTRSASGSRVFILPARVLGEFYNKLPWHADWEAERQRPFGVFSARDRIELMRENGLRLVYAAPERSQYLSEKFYDGRISVFNLAGHELQALPTNFVTIAEKVLPGDGVELREVSATVIDQPEYISIATYIERSPETGKITGMREVASRPNTTHDVIPYSVDGRRLWVRGREYPRPIETTVEPIDGSYTGGYSSEQLTAVVSSSDLESPEGQARSAAKIISLRAGIGEKEIQAIDPSTRYFVRADSIDEEVVVQSVEIPRLPLGDTVIGDSELVFGRKYLTRTFDGLQLIQGCQAGMCQDARMERKIYQLLGEHRLPFGPWLGERIILSAQVSDPSFARSSLKDILQPEPQAIFERSKGVPLHFQQIVRGQFEELTSAKAVRNSRSLEYVRPAPDTGLSSNSVPILPVVLANVNNAEPEIYVGLHLSDYPVAQEKTGSSRLVSVPTFRLPATVTNLGDAKSFADKALETQFGVKVRQISTLGGKYFVSPGLTPEVMYPFLAEIDLFQSRADSLSWIPLREILPHISKLHCGQAITALYRGAHALGQLTPPGARVETLPKTPPLPPADSGSIIIL